MSALSKPLTFGVSIRHAMHIPSASRLAFLPVDCTVRGCQEYNLPNGTRGHGTKANGLEVSGIISRLHWSCTMGEVTDELSNTILMGEIRPLCGAPCTSKSWVSDDALWVGTLGPINYPTCPGEPGFVNGPGCKNTTSRPTSHAIKSKHPGGCQFGLADGSVHFLSQNISGVTYRNLGGRRDGNVVDAF